MSKALKSFNRREKIDIVQYSNAQFLSILAPKSMVHCLRLSQYYFEYSYYIFERPRSFRNRQKLFIEKLCILKARDSIYGPSSYIGNLVFKRLGVKVSLIRTPYFNMIDKNRPNFKTIKAPYLLYFGTLSSSKGVDLIADVLYDILDKHKSIVFKFVGRNTTLKLRDNSIFSKIKNAFCVKPITHETTFVDLLKSSAKDHAHRVEHIPVVKPDKMQIILKGAMAVVLPSKTDNFPNTLSESLSAGKIVIVSTNSSLDEIVINGKNGFVFRNGDPNSLKDSIFSAINLSSIDEKKISNSALNTAKCILPEFVIANELLDFYKSQISKSNVRNSWFH